VAGETSAAVFFKKEDYMLKAMMWPVVVFRPVFAAYAAGCENYFGDTRACTWFIVITVSCLVLSGYVLAALALAKMFYRAILCKRIERWRVCQERIALGRKKRRVLRAIRSAGMTPVSEEGSRILSFYFGRRACDV